MFLIDLRGEIAQFDIKDNEGNVLVEAGRRISARHTRQMEKKRLLKLVVPAEYMIGRVICKRYVDSETGEVIVERK